MKPSDYMQPCFCLRIGLLQNQQPLVFAFIMIAITVNVVFAFYRPAFDLQIVTRLCESDCVAAVPLCIRACKSQIALKMHMSLVDAANMQVSNLHGWCAASHLTDGVVVR